MKRIICFLMISFLLSCTPEKMEKNEVVRLGVSVEALSLFNVQNDNFLEKFRIITLKPEERVKNLEVLLFSTKSSAFDGIVVPAITAPILKDWASPFPAEWEDNINKDVVPIFKTENGIYALPLNLDFPVFVYIKESFEALLEPKNLGILRDDLRYLKKTKDIKAGLVSSVPEEILFLSLFSSERGVPPDRLYEYHSLKLMEFFKEFDLSQIKIHQVESSLARGDSVAAFVNLSECFSLSQKIKNQGFTLIVTPLPSTSKSFSIFNGFCLMGYNFESKKMDDLKHLVEKDFQLGFLQRGITPVIKIDREPIFCEDVIKKTFLIGLPVRWEGMNFLKESIGDVLIYGDDPETALVRAEARLRNLDKK